MAYWLFQTNDHESLIALTADSYDAAAAASAAAIDHRGEASVRLFGTPVFCDGATVMSDISDDARIAEHMPTETD